MQLGMLQHASWRIFAHPCLINEHLHCCTHTCKNTHNCITLFQLVYKLVAAWGGGGGGGGGGGFIAPRTRLSLVTLLVNLNRAYFQYRKGLVVQSLDMCVSKSFFWFLMTWMYLKGRAGRVSVGKWHLTLDIVLVIE